MPGHVKTHRLNNKEMPGVLYIRIQVEPLGYPSTTAVHDITANI